MPFQSGSNSTSTGSSSSVSGKISGKKPFFLHPPNEKGEVQAHPGGGGHQGGHQGPELNHKILAGDAPNLDKRLRQYSAYELNRKIPKNKPTSRSSLSKNQIPPREHNTQ